jgi:fucose permease
MVSRSLSSTRIRVSRIPSESLVYGSVASFICSIKALRVRCKCLASIRRSLADTRPASFTDWIVVFLIRTRYVDAATAASASSVFWVGMALGRYALGAASERIGMRMAILGYIITAIGAQLFLISLVQLSGILVMLGVCGFFLAPLFPSGIVVLASQTEPRNRVSIVAGTIAMGQLGGAIVPFGLGLLATHVGIEYLLHVTLGLSVVLFVLWTIVSRICGEADILRPLLAASSI